MLDGSSGFSVIWYGHPVGCLFCCCLFQNKTKLDTSILIVCESKTCTCSIVPLSLAEAERRQHLPHAAWFGRLQDVPGQNNWLFQGPDILLFSFWFFVCLFLCLSFSPLFVCFCFVCLGLFCFGGGNRWLIRLSICLTCELLRVFLVVGEPCYFF